MEEVICDFRHTKVGQAKKKENGLKVPPHALFFTDHVRSHVAPAFYLSMELARKGIIVSFVSCEGETSSLVAEYKTELRGLDLLRFITLPKPQLPSAAVSFLDMSPAAVSFSDIAKLPSGENREIEALEEDTRLKSFKESKVIKALFACTEPPTCLIVGMFLWLSKELQNMPLDLKIPRYYFHSTGAPMARLHQAIEPLFSQGLLRIRNDDHRLEKFDGQISIPGLPDFNFTDLPPFLVQLPALLRRLANAVEQDADGVLINTFNDLEAGVLEALQKFTTRKGQKFYAIGPLAPLSGAERPSAERKDSDAECLCWLNSQPAASVIYICFGSLFCLSAGQVKELASELELSKRRFLWVIPRSRNSHEYSNPDVLPPGFEKRAAEFGYILRGWAPQLEVLSHPSTGAFLTHSGWKSCLEAISRGIPMIVSPIAAEQHVISKYMVDKVRIAAEICWSPDSVPESKSVGGAIRKVMEEEEGKAMKGRVKALQASLAAALAADGSAARERHRLAEDIRAI